MSKKNSKPAHLLNQYKEAFLYYTGNILKAAEYSEEFISEIQLSSELCKVSELNTEKIR